MVLLIWGRVPLRNTNDPAVKQPQLLIYLMWLRYKWSRILKFCSQILSFANFRTKWNAPLSWVDLWISPSLNTVGNTWDDARIDSLLFSFKCSFSESSQPPEFLTLLPEFKSWLRCCRDSYCEVCSCQCWFLRHTAFDHLVFVLRVGTCIVVQLRVFKFLNTVPVVLGVESLTDVPPPDEFIQIQLHPPQLFAPLISVCVSLSLLSCWFSLSFRRSVFIIPMNICSA